MHVRLRISVLATVAAALAIAGCGGSDALTEDEYAAELRDTLTPLGTSLQEVGADATAATNEEELIAALGAAEEALQTGIDQLDALEPPSDLADENDELVSLLDTYVGDVQTVSSAVEAGDEAADTQAVEEFQTASTSFVESLTALRTKFEDAGLDLTE